MEKMLEHYKNGFVYGRYCEVFRLNNNYYYIDYGREKSGSKFLCTVGSGIVDRFIKEKKED